MTRTGNKLGFMRCLLVTAVAAMSVGALAPALSAQAGDAVLLVARRQFLDPLYGASIVLAKPIGNRQHMGFILNKPTSIALRDAMPPDQLSPKVNESLYLGGPFNLGIIFALVNQPDSPGRDSIEFADDLYLATDRSTVQRIAAAEPDHARFFLGIVLWRPGELEAELKRGLWHVRAPQAHVVLRKDTAGLWEELVRQSEQDAYFRGHGI